MRNPLYVLLPFSLLLFVHAISPALAANHENHGGHSGGSSGSSPGGQPSSGGQNGGHNGHNTGQLKQGRYFGFVKMDQRTEKIALQADFFQESPEDFTQFPRLEAILKLSLGGYHTNEYLAYVFKNLRFDFETGDLTLDEPSNDLILSAKIHAMGNRTHIEGQVWSRSSAITGKFELTSESDEPMNDDETEADVDQTPFAPLLDGQYTGKCNDEGKDAVFQIQTVKDLRPRDAADGRELFEYEIIARLGYRSQVTPSPGTRPWETYGDFAGGSYDPYRGKLVFMGPSTTAIECARTEGRLTCAYRIQGTKVRCELAKQPIHARMETTFSRRFHINPTADQKKNLPEDGTVTDAELASLLAGHYEGYLHHEASDRYQRVALHAVTSISTENPHNPNKVFLSTTSVLYFGPTGEEQFISQRYEPRSFYIRPGFSLNAPGTDSFISIEEWKSGYIRGVWYSQEFGRVGTVEFVKGTTPSPLPASAKLMPLWRGEYKGLVATAGATLERWFNVIIPNQPAERLSSTVPFVGAFQSIAGLTRISPIERGAFDPYTGSIAWSYMENGGLSVVSGTLADDGRLLMYWPPAPHTFSAAMDDYKPTEFTRIDSLLFNRQKNTQLQQRVSMGVK